MSMPPVLSDCWKQITMLGVLLLAHVASAQSPTRAPGEPVISGREPGSQKEADWTDNRWAETDLGPFLCSSVRLPNASITKALSIHLGGPADASVVYDTETMALRGGWSGGFMRPDPARFGLIKSPVMSGTLRFVLESREGWSGGKLRLQGWRVNNSRLLLRYLVGETSIMESPSWLPNREAFLRSMEVGPHPNELRLDILPALKSGRPHLAQAVNCGRDGHLVTNRFIVQLVLPASPVPQQVAIAIGTTNENLAIDTKDVLHAFPTLLADLQTAGSARWLPASETAGVRGLNTGPLAVDTLTVPYSNPWKALMFLAGIDFTADGAAYVCTIHGDVWRVTGIDDGLRALSWKRFATGLYQPLGLKVRDNQVFVLCRDRLLRLHDENADGEADFYESFFAGIDTSPGGHDYVTSLEKDDSGNFYYVDPRGVHKVAADGSGKQTLATGFRNPNGAGVSPDGGVVTVAPQQGEWTPSSLIAEISPDSYFGYGGPRVTARRPLGYDRPLCWLPHNVDNASGSQVWIPPGAWGPLGGQMLHLLWGRCGLMLVLRDITADVPQGAGFVLPAKFLSGPNRATWNQRHRALYVAGSTGWQTSAVKDGALQRVRWTDRQPCWPSAWAVKSNGIELRFSAPLQRDLAEDPGSYALSWWNYRYGAQYGSKDWSVREPDRQGRDVVEIASAQLAEDGQTVMLSVPDLRPVMQFELKWNLKPAQGPAAPGTIYGTINAIPAAK